jgi:hypothetical protein
MRKQRNIAPVDRRIHHVSSWFSDAELAELDQRRGKLRRGSFVRSAALDVPLLTPAPLENLKAWQALAHTTANLNQIAKQLNSHTTVDIREVQELIAELRNRLIGVANDAE